jgi:hypothetical protein
VYFIQLEDISYMLVSGGYITIRTGEVTITQFPKAAWNAGFILDGTFQDGGPNPFQIA